MKDERERLGHVPQGFAASPEDGFDPLWTPKAASSATAGSAQAPSVVLVALVTGFVLFRSLTSDGGDLPFPRSTVMRAVVFSPDGTQVAYVARRALMVARSDSSAPVSCPGMPRIRGRGPRTASGSRSPWPLKATSSPRTNCKSWMWPPGCRPSCSKAVRERSPGSRLRTRTSCGDRILTSGRPNPVQQHHHLGVRRRHGRGFEPEHRIDGSDVRMILAVTSEGTWRPV